MANIKAGVAYVDIRLGSAKPLTDAIEAEVVKAGSAAGKAAGEKVTKGLTDNTTAKPASSRIISDFEFAKARVVNSLSSVGKVISKPFISAWNGVTSAWNKTTGAIGNGVKAVTERIATSFPRAFQAAVGAVNKFKSTLGSIPGIAAGAFSSIFQAVGAIPGLMSRASDAVGTFGKKIGLLGFQIKSLGAQMALAFTLPVVAVTGLATVIGLKLAAEIETVTVVMTTKFGPAGKKFIQTLEDMAAASPVFDTTSILQYAQRFTAAGLNIKQTQDFLLAFSNIAQTQGVTSTDKMNLALEAFAQILSKGKVQSEELVQQLAESLPGAVQIAAEAMHTTTPKLLEDLKAGKVSAQDFVDAITKLGLTPKYAKPASAAADTLAAKWSALKEQFQTGLAKAVIDNMDEIKASLDSVKPYADKFVKSFADHLPSIIDLFKQLVQFIDNVTQKWKDLSPQTQEFIKKALLLAIILGPILTIFGSIISALGAVAAAVSFLIDPVGLIILGIIALGVGLYALIKWIQGVYKEKSPLSDFLHKVVDTFKEFGGTLKEQLVPLLTNLKGIWEDVKKTFQDPTVQSALKAIGILIGTVLLVSLGVLFSVLKGVLGAIGPLLHAVADLVLGTIRVILGIVQFFIDLFTGNWSKLGRDLKSIWDGLWMAIVGTLYHLGEAIYEYVKGFVTGIVDFFKWLYNVLVGHSIIPDMVNAIISWFKKLVEMAKSLWRAIGDAIMWVVDNIIKPAANKVKDVWSAAIDFVKGIPQKIKDVFSGAISWLYNIGQDIVNGLINGIKSMASSVRNTLVGLLPDALKSFAGKLGLGSPSRLFHQYGVWTIQGYNQGVAAEAPKTVTAMNSWAAKITKNGQYNTAPSGANVPTSSGGPKAAIVIENYNATEGDSAAKTAERLYFLMTARGVTV